MNPNEIANAGIVTQLAVVHTMLPKVKELIDQLQAENEALKTENSHLKYEISSGAWNSEELTDQEIFNIYAYQQDTYTGDNFPVAVGRAILRKAQEK